ncbi:S9 family peptidase [Olivibacter sp. SDN3]|uniref:alpha/beta hydrolase family protein n=1 Tax=Olivibacter sp. SDN3 TaxID=2764720 RepID=UPI0016512367|nr:prolyl oligopeptidase family serine peptidase [Olivibacter sp. SDN3]QNL51530.1 S9 family peptidase [Olivibacter sp. SDN3]
MKKNLLYLLLGLFGSSLVKAQDNLTYQQPPASIQELLEAPNTPVARINKSGSQLLLLQSPDYPTLEQVAQPILGLAGLRLNPLNNSSAVSTTYTSLSIQDVKSTAGTTFTGMPKDPQIGNITWSPNEKYIAFSNATKDGVELWLADVARLQARKLVDNFLNDAYGQTLQWAPDGNSILAQFVPSARGEKPAENPIPTGPIVQENLGKTAPSRTYQNLLKNPYDEQLMDYHLTSQLYKVSLSGEMQLLGSPAIYRNVAYSPDGKYLLLQKVERPYSYLVPIYSFPFQTSICKANGEEVKVLAKSPLAENLPTGFDAVIDGPRNYAWRSDKPATLYWVEAQDGGDPGKNVAIRDIVYTLKAPFIAEPEKIMETGLRYSGLTWGNDNYAVLHERWLKDRSEKMTLINPDRKQTVKVIADRSSEDAYTDPGDFVKVDGKLNQPVLLFDKGREPIVFTIGTGASPEGDRPFLLKWNLISGAQDTLFKSKAPYYEEPMFFNNKGEVYISRESVEDAPNLFRIDLKSGNGMSLTSFPDPYPSLKGVTKQQLSYPRKDGIKLTATLYLPKGYTKEQGPLPVLMWAYPREFKSLAAAGQVKGSPYRFTRLAFRSPVYWVTRGYAILDQTDMPIVGEGEEEPNDTFVEQVQENARAVIDYVVDMGIADRKRIAVGGHSYGAFMTANLLAHTDLFAAGLARSGAYNRTLTPFGFQYEERTYWEAPEVYYQMSPFSFANKIKTPLLMTHGIDDENSGTFPIQSERLYNAIKGHGGTVRLVLLPKEFHGYRAKESIMHTFWEMDTWLEKYVKNRDN